MKTKLLTIIVLFLLISPLFSQTNRVWNLREKSDFIPNKTVLRESFPSDFIIMETNFINLKQDLSLAPDRALSSLSIVEILLDRKSVV